MGETEDVVPAGLRNDGWEALAATVGDVHDADVILYSGGVEHEGADRLIRIAKSTQRRPNAFLMLTTRGGSADAAFRMARCLQTHYDHLVIYIHGMCKSAGTLVAVGADEIVLSDFGEFGPLDVQLGKKDELFESTSGLDINQALNSLNVRTYDFFRHVLIGVRTGTRGQVSTKLAAEIATKLAVGAYSHVFSQIDPAQLGANERALQIAVEYGNKLSAGRKNVRREAIERLATGYPSHSFVIDLEEAKSLFRNVRTPTDTEERLGECISFVTRDESDESIVELLNKPANEQAPKEKANDDGNQSRQDSGEASQGESGQGGANRKVADR